MSHFQHLICYLYSIVNKIQVYEICKLLHSFFIHNLYSVPTFLESGLYVAEFRRLSVHCAFGD